MIHFRLFLSKNKKRDNDNVLKFIFKNIKEINESGYYIVPIIIDKDNIKQLEDLEIYNNPALYNEVAGDVVIGVNAIIKYIISLCEGEDDDVEYAPTTEKTNKPIHIDLTTGKFDATKLLNNSSIDYMDSFTNDLKKLDASQMKPIDSRSTDDLNIEEKMKQYEKDKKAR